MAFSRLEKIGNIYTRVTGLLKAGAMKWEDRPLFYDIYTAFPPLKEHQYMEDPPEIKIREIFYEEDKDRAARDYTNMLALDLNEKQPKRFDRSRYVEEILPQQQSEDTAKKEKIFDLTSIDLEKN